MSVRRALFHNSSPRHFHAWHSCSLGTTSLPEGFEERCSLERLARSTKPRFPFARGNAFSRESALGLASRRTGTGQPFGFKSDKDNDDRTDGRVHEATVDSKSDEE